MATSIQNKSVLVTGANRGIGKAIVETLIANGAAKVYAAVRRPESANSLVEAYGDKIVPVAVDLSQPDSIYAAAQTATDVDIVINNAGVLTEGSILADTALENLDYEHTVNVLGLIHVAKAFAPVLKANGGGAFVQLNSVASYKTFGAFATYCASKAAAYAVTQALREDLRAQNTQVVSVHPGPIATDMAKDAGMGDIAEPPSLVADSIVEALANDTFHAYPDTMAKQVGGAYDSFSEAVILPIMEEA